MSLFETSTSTEVDDRLILEGSLVGEAPDFANDVLLGLSKTEKSLPSVYFYDRLGSQLFEQICQLPEYYVTRTELAILRQYASEIVAFADDEVSLAELGSGSSLKTRILIEELIKRQGRLHYHPIDISRSILESAAVDLLEDHPQLRVTAQVAEYFVGIRRIRESDYSRLMVAFLGSNIGNFSRGEAREFLASLRAVLSPGDRFLLGTDMQKDVRVLEEAYNDSRGVTAQFNLNLLRRINEELGGGFQLENFRHRACFNPEKGRIEMRLTSLEMQEVRIGALGRTFSFEKGEEIYTESSYKYTPGQIEEMGAEAGLELVDFWSDDQGYFRVNLLRPV